VLRLLEDVADAGDQLPRPPPVRLRARAAREVGRGQQVTGGGRGQPASTSASVDFPAPFGPTRQVPSPAARSRSTRPDHDRAGPAACGETARLQQRRAAL
jgi:hypothetical protein